MAMDLDGREEYLKQLREFSLRTKQMGLGDVENYYWYHTIDLGNGLITPGSYDFRVSISHYQFPEDMHGMRVLDIGSATGFFAFEFEKRGAEVTSVELPSLADLDRSPGQTSEQTVSKLRRMLSVQKTQTGGTHPELSVDEIYHLLLEGPFQFCRKLLGSRVRRCYSTIYNLSAEILGRQSFDMVFIGAVLLHTINPQLALAVAARFCGGELILAQHMPETDGEKPVMLYVGGSDPAEDNVSWWLPNKVCFVQMLKKSGFRTIEDVGNHPIVTRQTGNSFNQTVLRAIR